MRYMMLLSGTNPATPPPPELFEAIMTLGGEASEAGVLLDTAGLLPSVRVHTVGIDRVIDFNLAYHPSCVYDARFSCPLTPAECRERAAPPLLYRPPIA